MKQLALGKEDTEKATSVTGVYEQPVPLRIGRLKMASTYDTRL